MNYFLIPAVKRRPLPKEVILKKMKAHYGYTLKELRSANRKEELVFVRHLTMFLLSKRAKLATVQIGKLFSRHHTTVIHAIISIENYIATDSKSKRVEILQFY
jgi:chromosomal replication initiation ATPase DnaA